jgi:hypothetical protein
MKYQLPKLEIPPLESFSSYAAAKGKMKQLGEKHRALQDRAARAEADAAKHQAELESRNKRALVEDPTAKLQVFDGAAAAEDARLCRAALAAVDEQIAQSEEELERASAEASSSIQRWANTEAAKIRKDLAAHMLDAILVHSKLIQLEGLARAAGYEEVSVSSLGLYKIDGTASQRTR